MTFPPNDALDSAAQPAGFAMGLGAGHGPGPDLQERLRNATSDRASTANEVVRGATGVVLDWLAGQPSATGWDEWMETLDWGFAEFREAQAWRGPVAVWLDTLEALIESGQAGDLDCSPRDALAEELGLWLGGAGAGSEAWSGTPLSPGRRFPDEVPCGAYLLDELERGEVLCVHGFSHTVALALEGACRAGKSPEVIVSEGGPDLGGRRMARRLSEAGLHVRYVYDAAVISSLARADRLLLGTEAVGVGEFLGLVGTHALCREARRIGVPVEVLACGNKLLPASCTLALPRWSEHSLWQLWGDAPEGVRVESQSLESVPSDLPTRFISENGPMTVAEYSLQFLRTGRGL